MTETKNPRTEKCRCGKIVRIQRDPESVGKRYMVEWHEPRKKGTFCVRSGKTRG